MLVDSSKKLLVLRIAYAGAPLSGKTATMKSLMAILRGHNSGELVYSPLEARGRTIYFDWAEYQGGSFRDGQVKCQITSVPGQESLRRRRHLLVQAADAVVFVIDSRPDQMDVNRRSLAELRPWLDRNGLAPIDIVYQCNKRDLPGTLGMDQIRQELTLGPDAELYESSAVQGEGVRIAFVAAIRFGVRQAEVLRSTNLLPIGTPEISTGEQLLDQVRLADDPNAASADAEPEPEPASASEPQPAEEAAPTAAPAFEARAEPAPAPLPVPEAKPPAAPATAVIATAATPVAIATPAVAPPARPWAYSSSRARPAVMPMADWLARQEPGQSPGEAPPAPLGKPNGPMPAASFAAAASPATVATPAVIAARPPAPAPRARFAASAGSRERPAVLPMADWLAQRAAQAAEAERPQPETPAEKPPEPVAAGADSEILKEMSGAPPTEPIDVEAVKVVAAAPAPAMPKPLEAQEPATLPAPWLRGGEAGVLEAWPPAIWEAIRLSVDPSLDPPKANLEVLQGRIGGGWHARSGGVSKSLEAGRAQFQKLVDWITRLDDAVSVQRCIVFSVGSEGWRAWQLVRELPTLGMLLQQGLEPGLPSRKAVQILSRISTDFVSTCRDFAARNVELPLLLRTLAKEHGRTVYSGFLPNSPVPLRNGDALVQLESELRPLAKAQRLSALNIPETLIELEQLSARSPAVLPIVELLQSLLIGE